MTTPGQARITNPLPQLIPDRLKRLIWTLRDMVWQSSMDLPVKGGPVNPEPVSLAEAQRQPMTPVAPRDRFGPPFGEWRQRWFRVDVPAADPDEVGRRFLEWQCAGEATAYLDGAAYAGLDLPHTTCPLPDCGCVLWIDVGLYGVSIGGSNPLMTADGAIFDQCRLNVRNLVAWQARWDIESLKTLIDHHLKMQDVAVPGVGYHPAHECLMPLTRQLLRAADDLCDIHDLQGLDALAEASERTLRQFPTAAWDPVAALCGHAHIDAVWLWPEWVTKRKVAHTYATQLRLMERYPEFVFTQSQPVYLRWLQEREPALFEQIRRRIQEGRWELTGAFEVEPDTNLPCGEALARSIALGQAFIREVRGEPARLCWLPDVFGYSAALPQILRLSDVPGFFTTKLSWSAITRFPYTSFVWRGTDGSEVLTHLAQTYGAPIDPFHLDQAVRGHRQADVHPEVIYPSGWSDGGGGTGELEIEMARRFADISSVPRTQWTRPEDVMDRLAERRDKLPVYQGELYLEFHRGTYTTQSQYKAAYRALERALQTHEAVRAAMGGAPLDQKTWLRLAFGQFHDALPGSSITMVYDQLVPELRQLANDELAAAAGELAAAGRSTAISVFNPLPIERTAVVAHGDQLALLQLPPLATTPFGASLPGCVAASSQRLANGIVEASFNDGGQLAGLRIRDRRIELAGPSEFRLYHDLPHEADAWDIDHQALKLCLQSVQLGALHLAEHGPLRARLRGEAALGDRSTLYVDYLLDAGAEHLECIVTVDWSEDGRLLKFHLPTLYSGRMGRFGAPFGSVQRPQLPGTPADEAQWEVPGSRWAAVVDDDGQGAALIAEAKYGFSCKDGDLGLSLLRAPNSPDPKADKGVHVLRFAIGRYVAATTADILATAACADSLYTPPVVVPTGAAITAPFRLSNLGGLVPSWVIPAADGYTIRLHEVAGSRGKATLTLSTPAQSVELTDLTGRTVASPAGGGSAWTLPYRPYQIVSVRVRR